MIANYVTAIILEQLYFCQYIKRTSVVPGQYQLHFDVYLWLFIIVRTVRVPDYLQTFPR